MHRTSAARPRPRAVLATLAAATLALGLTACGGDDDGDDGGGGEQSITVGVVPVVEVAPIYVGVDQGFFEDEGLAVELADVQGSPEVVEAVAAGDFAFGFADAATLLESEERDDESLQVVAAGAATTGQDGADFGAVVVAKGSDIRSAKDLAGERVGVDRLNSITTVTINESVRQAGGDPSTIEYVELPLGDIGGAVASGDVDAGQVVEPLLTIAQDQGDVQVVSNYVQTDPDLEVGMYFTSEDYAEQNRDVVREFTRAMDRSLEYVQEDPDAARTIMSDYIEMDPAVQDRVVLPRWDTELAEQSVVDLGGLMVQDGILDEKPDADALLD